MEVLEVWCEKCGTEPANYTFFYGNGNDNHHLGASSLVYKENIPEVRQCVYWHDVVHEWYKADLEF